MNSEGVFFNRYIKLINLNGVLSCEARRVRDGNNALNWQGPHILVSLLMNIFSAYLNAERGTKIENPCEACT